ncbi:MAG: glycoside hydrolase family 38 C-terminal domain-containing protein [Eubacteriales bacterium]|nr:glycoside hydrolase family 38 C-terminal domain-containing protein [Eubacteriales bacterium]
MNFLQERIGEILRQLERLSYPVEREVETWRGMRGHFPVTDEVPEAWMGNARPGWEGPKPDEENTGMPGREKSDAAGACVPVEEKAGATGPDAWVPGREKPDAVCGNAAGGAACFDAAAVNRLGGEPCAWFGMAADVAVPEEMAGMPVELFLSTGREGEWDATNPQIAAYLNGKLAQGMDVNHRKLRLTGCAKGDEVFSVFLSVYTGETGTIREWKSTLRAVDPVIRKLYYDLKVPWQCLALLEKDSREYEELLHILNDAVNLLDLRRGRSPELLESIERAEERLSETVSRLSVSKITASCIGHTHIDVAWRWTLQVTQEKAARSFATVLNLMERYPEYHFMSSQPQLYKYVKKNQPELYGRIREKVKEGRWEPEGAMFLEADCNLTSGESLVRQCLYGKKFFQEEFGKESKILWLPDVFGYSAALPQIMEKCGITSFMTTKISWNETNKIPFDTFWWEEIDGTRILTHFITTRDYGTMATNREFTTAFTTNYNGDTHPSQVKGAWQRYQQKGLNDNVLISYGYGDGGGGPTEEMLETARRLQDGHFDCPAVKLEPAGAFFDRLHQTARQKNFPVWSGELYLEYHRGTYTSMAENKRANRKGEFALLNAENWSVMAEKYAGLPYPAELLAEGWEILMRNQFHDILPGSSIAEVYEDSRREYQRLQEITGQIEMQAIEKLTEQTEAEAGELVVFNPNGMNLDGIVEISDVDGVFRWINAVECAGERCPVQHLENGKFLFRAGNVPAKGWKTFAPTEAKMPLVTADDFFCTEEETVTPFYQIRWNQAGQIVSFYDSRAGRELLQSGKCANVLMTYEDKPHSYDNWNIFEYYKEKQWPVEKLVSRQVKEEGPLRMTLELSWEYLRSTVTETFSFYRDSPRIDIRAQIDWKEEQILLKALFPLDLNTREATYEIQYGNVKRSTTKNTSWEQARFEVCFQKWLDISEYGYGVSFFSDCKYGVSIEENEVGLTLLKSGCEPNPKADKGFHEFVYALMPHEGSWQEAGTVREAYALNNPLRARIKEGLPGKMPGAYGEVWIAEENVVAEVLKRAEDGKAEILRIYECWNRRTRTEVRFGEKFREVWVCDLMEKEERMLAKDGYVCEVEVKPFEIVTLKVV